MKHVSVLGEGAWGTAIATVLADNGHTVHLWCHDHAVAKEIAQTHTNHRYAPEIVLPKMIIPFTDLAKSIDGTAWIFEAVPVIYLRSVLEQIKEKVSLGQRWVILSKGIEQKTLLLPSQIINDVFNTSVQHVIISGPSFAHDLMRKQLTAVAVGTDNEKECHEIRQLLSNDYFKLYECADVIGMQIGGALKNVIALGIGILDGAGYTDNTKAFFLTQGLHEMAMLARAMGGKTETIYGLSGVGDLALTALGKHSKNYTLGKRLGRGESLEAIRGETHPLPEGINTTQSTMQLIQKNNLDLPLLSGIYQVIFEHKKIDVLLTNL